MSDMNVSRDSLSIDTATYNQPSYLDSPEFKKLPPHVKDSLTQTLSINELNARYAKIGEAPQLQTPSSDRLSIAEFFRAINWTKTEFRQQLGASEQVDQKTRRRSSEAVALQAQALSELYAKRKEELAKVEADSKQAIEELKKLLDEMQAKSKEQQDLIDRINAGNEVEKQKYQELNQAYEKYLDGLKNIGAVDLGNGKFLIPEEAKDKYNALTADYQKAVQTFNNYWSERLNQINQYNAATAKYNQAVVANNQAIANFIEKYKLADYLKDKGISIPTQVTANLRDASNYATQIDAPTLIDKAPATIDNYPLPPYVKSIASLGPPSLPNLGNFPIFDTQTLYEGVYHSLYEQRISVIDQDIYKNVSYWAFLNAQALFNPVQDPVPDPILNNKPLVQKLQPPAFINEKKRIKLPNSGNELVLRELGLENAHLQEILGRSLLKEILAQLKLPKVTEEQVEAMADHLLVLSIGLLGNDSLQSLFPALSALAHSFTSLPKDSPAFALLFSISLSNRIQENSERGITNTALATFLNQFPELAILSAEDKAKLEATLNLGLLLVASKLLEENLGLPGLLEQILPSLLPTKDPQTLVSQVTQEDKQTLLQWQAQIESHFIAENYTPEESHFLAQVGAQLMTQGFLTPTATSINSNNTINQSLLIDSVKAGLILTTPPEEMDKTQRLTQADEVAHKAVNQALAEGPYQSINQFRTTLGSKLQDLGIRNQLSEVVLNAVIIPLAEKSLISPLLMNQITETPSTVPISPSASIRPSTETPPLSTSTLAPPSDSILSSVSSTRTLPPAPSLTDDQTAVIPIDQLPEAELINIVKRRTLQVLTPQLGLELAKQVSEEVAKTFFGTPSPDANDKAQVKSPYSLINGVKNQLYHLKVEQNQKYIEALTTSFKETLKTTEDFYAFSLKVMDPAYFFIYSTNAGIMYAGHESAQFKKAIDIPI